MPGSNDLGPFGPGVNETLTEPANFGDSGAGTYTWFKDCTSSTSGDGTRFTAQWANRMLKYIRRACDGMGIPRNESDADRLLKAIQKADREITNVGTAGTGVYRGLEDVTGRQMLSKLAAGTGVTITLDEDGHLVIAATMLEAKIHPEIETATNKFAIVNNGNGTITLSAGQSVLWRGSVLQSTDLFTAPQRTFAHSANNDYHLRWSRTGGLSLKDLDDGTYNPTAAAEHDPNFDSTYDDLLIARITTNGSNVATIVPLANAAVMVGEIVGAARTTGGSETDHVYNFTTTFARTPRVYMKSVRPPGVGYDSDYDVYPVHVRRESIQIYSWSWHHAGAMQSPGFSYELRA